MPWSKNDYPDSMKNLTEDVRNKAIEIANAILEDNKSEERAISIGISQARKYYEDDNDDRPVYQVVADEDDWILKKKDGERAIIRKDTKDAVMDEARPYVNDHNGILAVYTKDGDESQRLYE